MSTAGDVLRTIAMAAAKEAIQWAVDKVRGKARKAGIELDDDAVHALIEAELATLYATTRAMATSIESDFATLEEAERKFRESPNVTVVDSIESDEDPTL